MSPPEPTPVDPDPTSVRVRKARDGHVDSLQWLAQRFAPLLLAQATHRLGARLCRVYDAQEIVADAWAVLLPRLAALVDASPHPASAICGR